jgi:cytidylate kinase
METMPNIITEKDYIYLKNLFYKNYYLYKELENISLDDKNIADLLIRVRNMHEDHMYFIIQSLKKENLFYGDEDE